MAFELTGAVKLVQDLMTFDSGFQKREIVVTTEDDRYPQEINFECLGDKVELLNTITAGQKVKVSFDIRGREYNGRYFNNLAIWKIEPAAAEAAGGGNQPPMPAEPPMGSDEEDDVPF